MDSEWWKHITNSYWHAKLFTMHTTVSQRKYYYSYNHGSMLDIVWTLILDIAQPVQLHDN